MISKWVHYWLDETSFSDFFTTERLTFETTTTTKKGRNCPFLKKTTHQKEPQYHFNPWVHLTFKRIIPTENMDVIYIWIHCNLVYVRWVHEIFVLMKYSLDRKPGQKALCPINIKFSGNNSWLHVIDTSPLVNTCHYMHRFLLIT